MILSLAEILNGGPFSDRVMYSGSSSSSRKGRRGTDMEGETTTDTPSVPAVEWSGVVTGPARVDPTAIEVLAE